jgi:heat shock protein HtpX
MPTPLITQNRRNNFIQTAILVLAMAGLNLLVGWLLLGQLGFWVALTMTVVGAWMAQGICPLIVLRMFRASRIEREMAPELFDMFGKLIHKAEITRPVALYYLPTRVPNAFAVGNRSKAAVALSDGLLRLLTPRELAGVVAHEVAHIRNDDLRVMVTADALGRVVATFSRIGLFLIMLSLPFLFLGGFRLHFLIAGLIMFTAPSVSIMLQLALSRRREFNADLGAAELTGDPRGLAMALQRLERLPQGGWLQKVLIPDHGTASPPAWLRTHPPTPERIQQLMEIEQSFITAQPARIRQPEIEYVQRESEPFQPEQPRLRHYVLSSQPRIRSRPRWHAGSGVWY